MPLRTPRRKTVAAASSLLLLGALGGWGWWPIRWVPQPAAKFPAVLERYEAAVAEEAQVAPLGSFVHTGHRAGSFQEFAKTLYAGDAGARRPVAELMDRAYDAFGLDGIEVDVRASPLNARDVVVVHDRIDVAPLDEAGRAYAEANTARGLLEHFLARERHRDGRRIVFELKAPRDGLDAATEEAVDRLARTLNEVLGPRADAALARGAVDLLSFNHAALERMHDALGEAGAGHGLYQIVTSNQYPEWIFRFGPQPPFDAALEAKLREVPWLRGVYFDPRFVDDFAQLFNSISEEREAHGLNALELHLSTFSHERADFTARLAAEPEPLRHVSGLIYEIRTR